MTFATMTGNLMALANWLVAQGEYLTKRIMKHAQPEIGLTRTKSLS